MSESGLSADKKINMSLDDIIKKEGLANKSNRAGGKRNFAGRKGVAVRRSMKGGRFSTGRIIKAKNSRAVIRRKSAGVANNAATVKMVNKLVKKAISQRMNQSLIRRATMPRRFGVAPRSAAVRPVGFRARRALALRTPRFGGRIGGISQRSRTILSSAVRRGRIIRQRQPIILSSSAGMVRGRGSARIGRLVSDSAPAVYRQRNISPARSQLVGAAPRMQQLPRRRQIIVQRSPVMSNRAMQQRARINRQVVVQQNSYTQPLRRGMKKRVFVQQPRMVFVNQSAQRRPRPVYERIQRVVNVQQPKPRFVSVGNRLPINRNAAQMRRALGIGQSSRDEGRFEPSSSFLQRVPSVNRKGRGFRGDRFSY